MKKFRKLCAVFLLGFLLAGCGAAEAGLNETEQAPAVQEEAEKEAEKDSGELTEVSEAEEDEAAPGEQEEDALSEDGGEKADEVTYIDVPVYAGKPYTEINGNVPFFTDDELSAASYEYYEELDALGRCGACIASIGQDIMPTKERESIGDVKPTGWHTVKYEGVVDGNYLYNRCHLLGFQLTGENANRKNLITGTRYMNVEGMLPFENMVADYVKETGNHVMYRVTPLFDGDNLVADGVLMEAKSVEDNGADILFNVFCYNVQPGVSIDYATGESSLDSSAAAQGKDTAAEAASASAVQERQGGQTSAQQETSRQQTPAQQETPQSQTQDQPEQQIQAEPQTQPEQQQAAPVGNGAYAVNAKNGKIHIVGGCPATGTSSKAMSEPVYFNTYEEAEAFSAQIAPGESKRKCGNCW